MPVAYHRYQVVDPSVEVSPVLSIRGFDVVWYGRDFRHYLISELQDLLDIYVRNETAKESDDWNGHLREPYKDCFEYYDKAKLPAIPFWRNLVVYDWCDHSNNANL